MSPDRSASDLFIECHGGGDRTWIGLHGWNGSHRTFAPLVEHLPPEAELLAVDLPGYGASAPPESWTLSAIGRRVASAAESHGVETCSLIGTCSGAVVGLFAARALGSNLEHFVLLEPFAYIPWYLSLLTTPVAGRFFYDTAFGTALGRRISNAFLDDGEESDDMMASFADADLEVPYRYLEMFDGLETPEEFAGLSGRKHLLYAEGTFEDVRRSVARWNEVWPRARVREIPDAGHLLLEDAPKRVGAYIRDIFSVA